VFSACSAMEALTMLLCSCSELLSAWAYQVMALCAVCCKQPRATTSNSSCACPPRVWHDCAACGCSCGTPALVCTVKRWLEAYPVQLAGDCVVCSSQGAKVLYLGPTRGSHHTGRSHGSPCHGVRPSTVTAACRRQDNRCSTWQQCRLVPTAALVWAPPAVVSAEGCTSSGKWGARYGVCYAESQGTDHLRPGAATCDATQGSPQPS
jgi:hypothetical protein